MKVQKLIIYGRLPGMNELLGAASRHWGARAKLKRDAEQLVMGSCIACHIRPVAEGVKPHIIIRCFEPNARRDEDNVKSGACKVIFDALQKKGIISGDGRKYIMQSSVLPVEVDRINPRIEVEIREEGENDKS